MKIIFLINFDNYCVNVVFSPNEWKILNFAARLRSKKFLKIFS